MVCLASNIFRSVHALPLKSERASIPRSASETTASHTNLGSVPAPDRGVGARNVTLPAAPVVQHPGAVITGDKERKVRASEPACPLRLHSPRVLVPGLPGHSGPVNYLPNRTCS